MAPRPLAPGDTISSSQALRLETNLQPHDETPDTGEARKKANVSATLTPETSTRSRWQRDFRDFRRAFDENMRNKPVKHDKGFVLLLSWTDELDDLKVKPEVDRLQDMFQSGYGFEVKQRQLEERNAQHQLSHFLAEFMWKHDELDTLLIIYYAGHGFVQKGNMQWTYATGQTNPKANELNHIAWTEAESNIKAKKADVLVMFDCCQAGGFGGLKVRSRKPNFEFIAACGSEGVAAGPGESSFTSALIRALGLLKEEERCPFTTVDLIKAIKECPKLSKQQKPELQRRDHHAAGIVWIAPVGELTPTYMSTEPLSEHRHAHHEYMDLRLSFYRRVRPEDARDIAQHLSRLVNEEDAFAKHIDLLDVSDYVSKYVEVWKSHTLERRKSTSSSLFQPMQTTTAVTYLTDSPAAIEPMNMMPPSRHVVPETQKLGPLHHLRMLVSSCFEGSSTYLQSMATWLRPATHEPILSPSIKIDETSTLLHDGRY
ncbi:hypothetical protein K491DRAFT_714156 [Lophiostoma macrostomum CBS 122681]|uniref:Peptidase C14 caspase domain-containing protein n=1 Tax=Lophiostoma macrostomum CBS 122681 TaxID=1314788 RepID=A0A6A6TG31_9PLEO|nr:hypothetical protein K491DRAFT_714156 [Lophiostoma macrostomum CBS 122681]